MKKVLIITYYWPPSGGAGVQRWLKFVKYLRDFGWEPVVYTAKNAEYPVLDPSLAKDIPAEVEIIRRPIWEPYSFYKRLIGQKPKERVVSGFLDEKGNKKLPQKISLWIRANVFIPDARCFWIKPSSRFLIKWLKKNPVDAIVTTGPPHSMHLIGLKVKQATGIAWLADFRDPWTNIDFAGDLPFSRYAAAKNKRLETAVLQHADQVVVVSELMKAEFSIQGGAPVAEITNGFDPDDFRIEDSMLRKDGLFSIVHTGSLNNRRNHPLLWKALGNLCENLPGFKEKLRIRLIGKNDISVRKSIEENGLEKNTEWIDYLPHQQIIAEQKSASLLLLSINNYGDQETTYFSPKATLTGKLFEYLAAERPILMIGPADSQAAEIIHHCGAGSAISFNDEKGMEQKLKDLFKLFQQGRQEIKSTQIEQFSRRYLTGKLAELLDNLITGVK